MNFFDYDLTRSETPPQSAGNQPEPSLNEEVQQVVGQLGRLWGGFRKQSQVAFETARKDLGSVVSQAQRELGSLTGEAAAGSSSQSRDGQPGEVQKDTEPSLDGKEGTENMPSEQPEMEQPPSPNAATSRFQSLFSTIQSSLPPNISSTLQNNIPQALIDAPRGVDFAQLKNTLTTEFQRVQGVTRAQAEEYVHKSEALFREAGEFLKENVKLVPPDENDATNTGVMWDGTDVWVMPSSSAKGKGRAMDSEILLRARAAGTRAETLLRQLKGNQELLKVDPAAVESTKGQYELFIKNDVESKEGGISGEFWSEKRISLLEDGSLLIGMVEALVPSATDESNFWSRYFFRVHQIEEDERKRKELLAGAPETEEDFNWDEDDEEDTATPSSASVNRAGPVMQTEPPTTTDALEPPRVSSDTVLADSKSYPSSLVTSPTNTSPRPSSEGSYDVVSNASNNHTGDAAPSKKAKTDEDEDDSDWE